MSLTSSLAEQSVGGDPLPSSVLVLATWYGYEKEPTRGCQKGVVRVFQCSICSPPNRFLDYSPRGTKNISRVPYSLNKGEQLNAVIHEVAPQYGVELFDFRKALNGYTQDCESSGRDGCKN